MGLTIIDNKNIYQKDVIGNVRTAQEDSHDIAALTPNGDVFVVCDGMGGHVGGKQASSIAVKSIIDYLKKEKYPQPTQALNEALQFANMQILGYANAHPELKGMGTTACIVLLQETEAYIAHVGDSRIYLYLGKEKQLHRITKDHSFVQTLVDAGQITDEEAEHHPNKNRILKALGIKPELSPTFNKVQPKNGDMFLICSDGLSGMISDSKIANVLSQKNEIAVKGDTLINLALEAGGTDNITVELIQIANSSHAKSLFKSFNPKSNSKGPKPPIVKKILIILGVIIVLSLFSVLANKLIQNKRSENQLQDLKKQIESVVLKCDSLQEEYDTKNNDLGKIEKKIKEREDDITKASNENSRKEYEKQLKNLQSEKQTLSEGIESDSIELASLKSQIDSLNIELQKYQQNESNNNRKRSGK